MAAGLRSEGGRTLLSPLAAAAETFYFWRDADGRTYLTNEPAEDFTTMPACDREQQRRARTDRLTGEPANLAQIVQLADGSFPSDKGRGYMDLEFFCFPAKHDPRQAPRP